MIKTNKVVALVRDFPFAARLAKIAKENGATIQNFDDARRLIASAKESPPTFVVLDWDKCEADAFKVLKEFAGDADLRGVPTVGYLSGGNPFLKKEAERAGCHRVYGKTGFIKGLNDLFLRYTI